MRLISTYFLLFLIYSFLGWFMEICLVLIENKKLVNRGFLLGPYCPIYGVGCLLIILCLKSFAKNPIILFIISLFICSGLEYATSYIMEKLFKTRWWDYSHMKYNINGRICLQNMLAFGILGTIVVYIVNPYFVSLLNLIPNMILYTITIILAIIFIVDNIISYKVIYSFKHSFMAAAKDNTEEINKKVHEIILKKSFLYKRLKSAYPNLEVRLKKTKRKIEKQVREIEKKIKG